MNKSFRLIIYLLLGLFVTDRLVGVLLESAYRQKPSRNIGALYHIIDQEKPYEQLVLGSSRALHGVVPELLTKRTFNMGWDGTSINMHLALLKIIESNKKLPKVILLNLDEKMVFDTRMKYMGIEELSALYDDNDWLTEEINKQSKYNRFLYLFKAYKFNGKALSLFSSADQFENGPTNGYIPLKPKRGDSLRVETLIKRKNSGTEFYSGPSSDMTPLFVANLMELLSLAKANKIELILFSPPLFGPRLYEPNKEKFYAFLCENGITYLDYRAQFRIDKGIVSNKNLWKDLSHLNSNGADIFTKQLNKDIEHVLSTKGSLPQELNICK